MKLIHKARYKHGDGFAVFVMKKAPKRIKEKADTIALATVIKDLKGKLIRSDVCYYTPDEAMTVAIGLLKAVDHELNSMFVDYRNKKNFTHRRDVIKNKKSYSHLLNPSK